MSNNAPNKLANIRMLELVAAKLDELCKELVFLGGSTTALFITDEAYPDVRFTFDVDCIVDVISHSQYYQITKLLKQCGFRESIQDNVLCRWRYEDIILDVMPTEEHILGFSNRWYKGAIKHATDCQLTDHITIKIVTAPYFLATKFEAFKDRGKSDYFESHDFEDIISIFDGRLEIDEEILRCDSELQGYILESIVNMYASRAFHDALPGQFNLYGNLSNERNKRFSLKLLLLIMKIILIQKNESFSNTLKKKISDAIKKYSNLNDWQKIKIFEAIRASNNGDHQLIRSSLNLALARDTDISKEFHNIKKIEKLAQEINISEMITDL